MKYTPEFTDDAAMEYMARLESGEVQYYGVDLGSADFINPPVLDASRYMAARQSPQVDADLEDKILHYLVMGVKTEITLADRVIGSFIITGPGDSWDLQPVFQEHPLAFMVFKNIALFALIKKYMPPLKDEARLAAIIKAYRDKASQGSQPGEK